MEGLHRRKCFPMPRMWQKLWDRLMRKSPGCTTTGAIGESIQFHLMNVWFRFEIPGTTGLTMDTGKVSTTIPGRPMIFLSSLYGSTPMPVQYSATRFSVSWNRLREVCRRPAYMTVSQLNSRSFAATITTLCSMPSEEFRILRIILLPPYHRVKPGKSGTNL